MHEIKAITRLTHTKEAVPTQPKTRDNFTSVLDELLGNTGGTNSALAAANTNDQNGQDAPSKPGKPGEKPLPPWVKPSDFPSTPIDPLNGAPVEAQSSEDPASPAITLLKSQKGLPKGGPQKELECGKTESPAKVPDPSEKLPDNLQIPADVTGLVAAIAAIAAKPVPDSPKAVETATAPQTVALDTKLSALETSPQVQLPLPVTVENGTPAETVLKTGDQDKPAKPAMAIVPERIVSDRIKDSPFFPIHFVTQAMAVPPRRTASAASVDTGLESAVSKADTTDSSTVSDADQETAERLTLGDFGVTRFEFKTEIEPRPFTVLQSGQILQMMRTPAPGREIKPVKLGSESDSAAREGNSSFTPMAPPPAVAAPEAVEHVRLVFEPPAPPPVVRSVSMDIGDPESQVRVVIRERNGSLNVQFGAGSEHLRVDLQSSGSLLMRELQRNNPAAVTLDFTNFGSATESDSQSRSQSEAKKQLKSGADFADVVESAYPPAASSALKSL